MTGRPVWWDSSPDDVVSVELPDEQRDLIVKALSQWDGPAHPTDALARAVGFADADALIRGCYRLRTALAEMQAMTMRDWARTLVATEIVLASSYYGAAGDWESVTGWSDERTLRVLRQLQRSLGGLRAPGRHGAGQQDPLAASED